MPRGTFSIKGDGSSKNPYTADLSSLENATTKAKFTRLISETTTSMTVEYTLVTLGDGDTDLFRNLTKGSALFTDAAWNGLTVAQKRDFLRTTLQNLTKLLLKGTP